MEFGKMGFGWGDVVGWDFGEGDVVGWDLGAGMW